MDLQELVRTELSEYLNCKGWIPYSGLSALAKGDYYLMGLNPAIDDSIIPLGHAKFNDGKWSAYKNQCWRKHNGGQCDHIEQMPDEKGVVKAPSRHQKEILALAEVLGIEIEMIFSANAVFIATATGTELKNISTIWNACWPIHQEFLSVVLPRWVICLGNGENQSSYSLLKQKNIDATQERKSGGPKFHRWKWFDGTFPLGMCRQHRCTVVGLPHPSHRFFGRLEANWRDFHESVVKRDQ